MIANLPLFVKYIITGIIGMVPIIELRGAIPIGVFTFHLNYIESFLCSFIGNIIPVYFIVKFIRPLFDFFGRWKPFKIIIDWASEKATKHIEQDEKLQNYAALGLFLFVVILGVLTAGIIVLTLTAIANGGIQYLLQRG